MDSWSLISWFTAAGRWLGNLCTGEDECAAALRLLGRLCRVYGPRLVDAVTIDGWYARRPSLRSVERLGWECIVVLKREGMDVYREAQRLSQGQAPGAQFDDADATGMCRCGRCGRPAVGISKGGFHHLPKPLGGGPRR
jgi:hypothetical protein